MDDGYFFDNIVVSNSAEEAAEVREKTWLPKKEIEVRRRECAGQARGGCWCTVALQQRQGAGRR